MAGINKALTELTHVLEKKNQIITELAGFIRGCGLNPEAILSTEKHDIWKYRSIIETQKFVRFSLSKNFNNFDYWFNNTYLYSSIVGARKPSVDNKISREQLKQVFDIINEINLLDKQQLEKINEDFKEKLEVLRF